MNPVTINTILNSAPVIIQAAGKLMHLLRQRQSGGADDTEKPATIEQLQTAVNDITARLDENDAANMEQTRLIEQLARQNELLASAQKRSMQRINLLFVLALVILLALLGLWLQ